MPTRTEELRFVSPDSPKTSDGQVKEDEESTLRRRTDLLLTLHTMTVETVSEYTHMGFCLVCSHHIHGWSRGEVTKNNLISNGNIPWS